MSHDATGVHPDGRSASPAKPLGSLQKVVDGGYCVGCGACVAVSQGRLRMIRTAVGTKVPHVVAPDEMPLEQDLSYACPFSSDSISEDRLADEFLESLSGRHSQIGKYTSNYVCAVTDHSLRAQASSGGFARWVLSELLSNGYVSHVAHVEANNECNENEDLFRFALTQDTEQVLGGAKSAYYPVSLEDIINLIREVNGTVAITAIPCFAKALRQVARRDNLLRSKIRFIVGIICGHMKSAHWGESLAWQVGVEPQNLAGVSFREKIDGAPANHKGFTAFDRSTSTWTPVVNTKTLLGGDWGLGLLKNSACEFCDDVVSETADMAVGDAWLPEYVNDSRGHSVVVVRSKVLEKVIQRGVGEGEIEATPVDADTIARSQAGGLRHRREGLAYRLWLKEQAGEWHPPKRVAPARDHIGRRRRNVYDVRNQLVGVSLDAFVDARRRGDLEVYKSRVGPVVQRYYRTYITSIARLRRLIGRLNRLMRLIARKWL